MTLLYRANNVRYDKCVLFYDFIKTLNLLVVNTYLGDDVTLSDEDIKKHFLWCFNKVVGDFKEENIIFSELTDLRTYFFHFFNELLYGYGFPLFVHGITSVHNASYNPQDYERACLSHPRGFLFSGGLCFRRRRPLAGGGLSRLLFLLKKYKCSAA